MSDSSSAGVKWLENVRVNSLIKTPGLNLSPCQVSGQHNSRSMTIIVGTILIIIAASISLFVVMIVYRRLRVRRRDEEANWVFVSEKRRTLFRKSGLDSKEHDLDENPNWVPFRPPALAAVPKVHLRSPPAGPAAARPLLRSLFLGTPSATAQPEQKSSPPPEHQVRRVPPPTIETPEPERAPTPESEPESESKATDVQPTARPTNPRSPPRLTVKVPPPASFTPSIVTTTPSPKTVRFLPGPPSSASAWRAEARDRWTRATHVLKSPLLPRSKGNTPVTTSFLDSKKRKSKSKAARKAEEESEFWSAGASETRATQKLDALISQLQKEYSAEL